MILEKACERFGWPAPVQILNPEGAGPQVYAGLAREKVGRTLKFRQDVSGVDVGVIVIDPSSDATEAPLAIICEFYHAVSSDVLRETHRLAWSFCRSPLLITIEPHLIRAWTCCEAPADYDPLRPVIEQYEVSNFGLEGSSSLPQQAAESLHWVHLVSGEFFRKHESRFQRAHCADLLLLQNLRYVRERLHQESLEYPLIHDLLARLIFIQFLFQRKDSSGTPALDEGMLESLHAKGLLSYRYKDLAGILHNAQDTFSLFRWLDNKFNGDLFPGKIGTPLEREAEWQNEIDLLQPVHFELLADFVSGTLRMETGQSSLWPEYSFDAIPLDFISSIYEEFVRKSADHEPGDRNAIPTTNEGIIAWSFADNIPSAKLEGIHYTPGYMVDFMLDRVLPWHSEEWDIKILDPACGSGIFLVKAFQRLIYRWKLAHKDEKDIDADVLSHLLTNNIFGVDVNPEAIRVASVSLYLTMCDEIDPRYYWERVHFPTLRGQRLIPGDFFREDIPGLRTRKDARKYDLVVGNPPWGGDSLTDLAEDWVNENAWPVTNKDIGPVFLGKAVALVKEAGQVQMIQPAMTLLFNRIPTALKLRKKIFSEFKVEEVVNLSALRFDLFKDAVSPSCVICFRPLEPDDDVLWYICPKPLDANQGNYRIIIEPNDANWIYPHEAANDPWVWTALMWGGRRDFDFIRKLRKQVTLEKLEKSGMAVIRRGVSRGDQKKKQEQILGRRILEERDFPEDSLPFLNAERLPVNENPWTHSRDSTDMEAFKLPQLLLKQGWKKRKVRFQAAVVNSLPEIGGVFCSRSYVSVHVPEESETVLEAACLTLNSIFAVYFLFLTSGRFASYRPEVNLEDLLRVPIPKPRKGLLENLDTYEELDRRTFEAFAFKESDQVLVEDLYNYTLPDFKEGQLSPGRRYSRTDAPGNGNGRAEPYLGAYCDYFLRSLRAGFGPDKTVCATIFQESSINYLPIRLVAIHLNWPGRDATQIVSIDSPDLLSLLGNVNVILNQKGERDSKSVSYQRVIRAYDSIIDQQRRIPTVYIIKPDQVRYWTRSMALRDADELAEDIMLWQVGSSKNSDVA